MKLKVVVMPVADVDRTKYLYQGLGRRQAGTEPAT
jgi:hypothetical protein